MLYFFLSDRFGLIHQARISASVNAMRILNTGMEVEAAVADALVRSLLLINFISYVSLENIHETNGGVV